MFSVTISDEHFSCIAFFGLHFDSFKKITWKTSFHHTLMHLEISIFSNIALFDAAISDLYVCFYDFLKPCVIMWHASVFALPIIWLWLALWIRLSTRVKKLRETLVAVQQLDKNMSSLRSWLAHIETELSRPIVYDTCDDQEIQRKLNQQQASGTSHTFRSNRNDITSCRHATNCRN